MLQHVLQYNAYSIQLLLTLDYRASEASRTTNKIYRSRSEALPRARNEPEVSLNAEDVKIRATYPH